MLSIIRKIFRRRRMPIIEPLLHSNAERLFDEWSSGFGILMLPSGLSPQMADTVGSYAVKGRNPNATSEPLGSLRLEPNGSLVKAYWEIGHTRQPQHGMGFLKDDLLALDFYYSEEGTRFYGQVIYRIDGDRLIGFWRENHVGDIALEEATLKNRL